MHRPAARLPVLRTEVVGREAELDTIVTALAGPGLVTLSGPGGVGKTTLALAAAGRAAADQPDGAWFVDLSAVEPAGAGDGADVVADVVGEALALRRATDPPTRGSAGWVADTLRDHRLVLVLDNCEHVVEAAATVADRLLLDAPGVTVLVTSREPLGVAGERVVAVAPLTVPDPRDQRSPEVVATFPAVQLFVARARAAGAALEVDGATAPLLGTLCRRLDGLPLALELAATRVPALGLPAVVTRLGDRFRLLGSGRRGGPERHRTLEAMLDWSWDLLDDAERRVLRRLAVHADGCTVEAAGRGRSRGRRGARSGAGHRRPRAPRRRRPGPAPPIPPTSPTPATYWPGSSSGRYLVADHGEAGTRYRLLESVGAYAAQRLVEAGEDEAVRRRHVRWYRCVAEQADATLRGPDQGRWLAVLDAESANMHSALDTAAELGLADDACRLAAALGWYWVLRSRTGSARRMLDRALTVADRTDVPSLAAARAQAFRAAAALGGADLDDHTARCATALAAFDGFDDAERGRAGSLLGAAALEAGLVPEAEALLTEALAIAVASGDRWGEAVAMTSRCMLAHMHGDPDGLEAEAMRAESLFAELGDDWGRLAAGEWLGAHAELIGDLDRGVKLLEDGLDEAERLGLWRNVAGRLGLLGWIALQRGDWARATELGEQTKRLAVEQGERSTEMLAGMVLAFTARQVGELDRAEACLRDLLTSSGLDPDALFPTAATSAGAPEQRGPGWRRARPGSGGRAARVDARVRARVRGRAAGRRARGARRSPLGAQSTRAAGYPRGMVGGLDGAAAALAALGEPARRPGSSGPRARGPRRDAHPAAAAEQRDVDRALDRVVADLGQAATDRLLAPRGAPSGSPACSATSVERPAPSATSAAAGGTGVRRQAGCTVPPASIAQVPAVVTGDWGTSVDSATR